MAKTLRKIDEGRENSETRAKQRKIQKRREFKKIETPQTKRAIKQRNARLIARNGEKGIIRRKIDKIETKWRKRAKIDKNRDGLERNRPEWRKQTKIEKS